MAAEPGRNGDSLLSCRLRQMKHITMNIAASAALGIVFLLLGGGSTFLMYFLWGFPFNKATRTSEAPRPLMRLHRVMGYSYGAIYLFMMSEMVPRMWQYQVELPARTVAHLVLGFVIGIILLLKISIMRFFRHFEEWMPALGTLLFVCTVLLLGLSLPTAFREGALASGAVGGGVYSAENRKRTADLLKDAGLPAGARLKELSTTAALRKGRAVLMDKCVRCHDLKTILARPRTPADWAATVGRMAEKPALFTPITEDEQWKVSAYLIAITPDIQKALKGSGKDKPRAAAPAATSVLGTGRTLFQKNCITCHGANGEGGEGPSLQNMRLPDPTIATTIKAGIKGEMPAFGSKLKEGDVKALTAFIHSLSK